MIQARCLRSPIHRFTKSCVASASPSRYGQKFYSAFAGATLRQELATNLLTPSPKAWRPRQWVPQRPNGGLVSRFASTFPTPAPIAEVQSDYVPAPQISTPTDDIQPESMNGVIPSESIPVYDYLGFLKELGLDYGWGPTALMETLLEHVHIYLGTPWWASIGISVLIVRAILFKFFIDAADINARRQLIKHLEEPITARIKTAQAEKNQKALQEAWFERRALHKSAGISMFKSLVPLLQLPIGYGTFRLMRGLAYLPVPGFDSGGLLWMTDLTQSDPLFILPIATAAAYYFTFKRGGETGNSDLLSPRARQIFLYGLPPFSGLVMMFWPGGLQLTFFITAMFSNVQATLFGNDWFRKFVGIQPLPKPAAQRSQSRNSPRYQAPSTIPSTSETPKGMIGSLKGAVSDIMKAGEKFSSLSRQKAEKGRLTIGEKQHAKAYEAKRKREIVREAEMRREFAQSKFERKQELAAQEQEMKEGQQDQQRRKRSKDRN